MPIIKKTIVLNNTKNVSFSLESVNNKMGSDQIVNELVKNSELESINSGIDNEVYRYKYSDTFTKIMHFNFFSGSSYYNSYLYAGFTSDEIVGNKNPFTNSFYIIDVFDSIDIYSQKAISKNYFTNLTRIRTDGFIQEPNYLIGDPHYKNQMNNVYLPKYFTDSKSDSFVVYLKISFYNAKTGKISPFYNVVNESSKNSDKLFFDITINKLNRSWKFNNQASSYIYANELNNSVYQTKLTNTSQNITNINIDYPSGGTFNYNEINYI